MAFIVTDKVVKFSTLTDQIKVKSLILASKLENFTTVLAFVDGELLSDGEGGVLDRCDRFLLLFC